MTSYVVVEFLNERYRIPTSPMKTLATVLDEFCAKTWRKLSPADHILSFNKKPVDLELPCRLANLPNGVKLEVLVKHNAVPVQPPAVKSPRRRTPHEEVEQPIEAGEDRAVVVFHRESLFREMETQEVSEEFFEFTQEDYHRVIGSYQNSQNQTQLKTQAMRDTEELMTAAKLPEIKIRYFFPDGMVCEVEFSALDQIKALYDMLARLVRPNVVSELFLFTAPPRVILKEKELSLFKAKLVPAANVYVGSKSTDHQAEESLLKEEILAQRVEFKPEIKPLELIQEEEVVAPDDSRGNKKESRENEKEKKVPKWFKMGK